MSKPFNNLDLQRILSRPKLAEQFKNEHKDRIRFCVETGKWFAFDGARWKESVNYIQLRDMLGVTTENYYNRYLPQCANEKQAVKFQKFINKSLEASTAKRILADAEIYVEIQISKKDFDNHPTLITVPNGTINLETGELRPSDPEDYLTHMAVTSFYPEQDCPRFKKFILEIANGSQQLADYILLVFAYCITGLSSEQKVYVFYGPGANGKSVSLEVLRETVGHEFIIHVDSKTLVKNGRTIREDIARFEGRRLATCSEIGAKDTIDEPLLKGLSGGDQVTGRLLHQNSTEFSNTAKIILSINFLPEIEGAGYGIERRLEVIPLNRTFKGDDIDKELKERLLEEKQGILALLVQHAKRYLDAGMMVPPQEVVDATAEYVQNGNSVKRFKKECCDETVDHTKESSLSVVYAIYVSYCHQNGLKSCSTREFTRLMKLLGYEQRKSGSDRYWKGLMINMQKTDGTINVPTVDQGAEVNISQSINIGSGREASAFEVFETDAPIELGGSMKDTPNDVSDYLGKIPKPGGEQSDPLKASDEAAVEESMTM